METTYGDRVHETVDESLKKFLDIVLKTIKRGGNIIIPSFAVGRTQELIYELSHVYQNQQEDTKALEKIKVYVDSPLATKVTEIFRQNRGIFDQEAKDRIQEGEGLLAFKNLRFTRTSEESRSLNKDPAAKIIISSSGMCDSGRIKHHLKHNLWKPESSIIFVGFQAEGTLGSKILRGDKLVDIFDEKIQVKAEIYSLEGFSGHGDQKMLLEWLGAFTSPIKKIFLVHGEQEVKHTFAKIAKERLGRDCQVIDRVETFTLE